MAPKFIQEVLPEITPAHRTWLTVRNDDIYSFRWGDPDFARGGFFCFVFALDLSPGDVTNECS